MRRVYVDANVFLHAIGDDSRYRERAREVVTAIARGAVVAETSVITLQEVVHHRGRRGDGHATARGRDVDRLCTVRPLTREVGLAALELVDAHAGLRPADAIHVATALAHGVVAIVSADRDFDAVADVERVDPLDRAALARLLSE